MSGKSRWPRPSGQAAATSTGSTGSSRPTGSAGTTRSAGTDTSRRQDWRPGADVGASVSGRRREVLAGLRELGGTASIAEVAARVDMHANTVRFHLEALAEQGLVERDVATPVGPGRPALVFRLRRGMDPAGPRNYRLLAAVLVDQLAAEPDAPARAVRAGRAWGSRLIGPVGDRAPSARRSADQIVDLLDDIGFAPEHPKSKDWRSVPLRHCPFLDLVDNRTDVICPIHLGLMQGAAEALGGRTRVDGLEPFVEPGMCLAHLSDARAPAGGSADGGNSGTRSRS